MEWIHQRPSFQEHRSQAGANLERFRGWVELNQSEGDTHNHTQPDSRAINSNAYAHRRRRENSHRICRINCQANRSRRQMVPSRWSRSHYISPIVSRSLYDYASQKSSSLRLSAYAMMCVDISAFVEPTYRPPNNSTSPGCHGRSRSTMITASPAKHQSILTRSLSAISIQFRLWMSHSIPSQWISSPVYPYCMDMMLSSPSPTSSRKRSNWFHVGRQTWPKTPPSYIYNMRTPPSDCWQRSFRIAIPNSLLHFGRPLWSYSASRWALL